MAQKIKCKKSKSRNYKKTLKRSNKLKGGKIAKKSNKKLTKKIKKGGRAASSWNKHVMKVFKEMKKKDKNAKFGDALKKAASSYKK